jgi:hypothetical protein
MRAYDHPSCIRDFFYVPPCNFSTGTVRAPAREGTVDENNTSWRPPSSIIVKDEREYPGSPFSEVLLEMALISV